MLQPRERFLLAKKAPQKQGNPVSYTAKGLMLESGEELEGDVIIWCTGYTTGIYNIDYNKDEEKYELSNNDPLFEHMIVPDFPVLAIPGQVRLWETLGEAYDIFGNVKVRIHIRRYGRVRM